MMKCKRLFIVYSQVVLTTAVCYNIFVSRVVDETMIAVRTSTLYEITIFYEKEQWIHEFDNSLRRYQHQSELFTDMFGYIFLMIGIAGVICSYFLVGSTGKKKTGNEDQLTHDNLPVT